MVLAERLADLSRSGVGRLIRAGHVKVNGQGKKPGYLLKPGDQVFSQIPPPINARCEPEPIPLSILHEDSDLVVLNKPPGLVVHPAPGHWHGTLVNALLNHCQDLEGIGGELRPGIVHRLDKETSGILVVAKKAIAHEALSRQFKERLIKKTYLALVYGRMPSSSGIIDLAVGRHPKDRKRMSTKSRRSRSSETRWRVKEALLGVTLLELDLKTGRTHQIRVHCEAIGHPVVGDIAYGGKRRWKDAPSEVLQRILQSAGRQMLHAWKLTFEHPRTGKAMDFEAPLAEDMAAVLEAVRRLSAILPNPPDPTA